MTIEHSKYKADSSIKLTDKNSAERQIKSSCVLWLLLVMTNKQLTFFILADAGYYLRQNTKNVKLKIVFFLSLKEFFELFFIDMPSLNGKFKL